MHIDFKKSADIEETEILWSTWEKVQDLKENKGICGDAEELNSIQKVEARIIYMENLHFEQYLETTEDLESSNCILLNPKKMEFNMLPNNKFHFGSTTKRFDYYVRFFGKWVKRLYSSLLIKYLMPPYCVSKQKPKPLIGLNFKIITDVIVMTAKEDLIIVK